ncbi:ubiquitin-like domain-containing protein [Candidatus Saccharibacteria bacterium]|nr:ubiquitin-like domain-containing protein [Candidatus Saccharibacteria bacterium]
MNTKLFRVAGAVLGVVLMLGLFSVGMTRADDGVERGDGVKLVAIHDRGQRRVVQTSVETVAELLELLEIEIHAGDLVEPGLGEEIISSDFRVNIFRARPMVVVDGMSRMRVMTAAQTNEMIAEEAGVELLEQDGLELRRTGDFLETGTSMELVVLRSRAITLNFFGTEMELRTRAETVGEFLAEREIDADFVSRDLDELIYEGMELAVWRDGVNLVVVEEEIEFGVEQIRDYGREAGYRRVEVYGETGRRMVTFEVEMYGGVEVGRVVVETVVVRESVTQREVIGTRPRVSNVTGTRHDWLVASGIPERYWWYVDFIVHRESTWNPNAVNRSSGACGLGQQLPCGRWDHYGPWNDPVAALRAMHSYVNARYFDGSIFLWGVSCSGIGRGWPCAHAFWLVHGWY